MFHNDDLVHADDAVGWPSGGGNVNASVAGISEMQTFLNTWVCPALKNQTNYFYFEAMDEVKIMSSGRQLN